MKHISEVYSRGRIHFLPEAIGAGGVADDVHRVVSCDSGLTLLAARSQVLFSLYFWTRLLNGFLIDCDPDQWLAVAGLLSQYWIYSVSLPCLHCFLPCLELKEVHQWSSAPTPLSARVQPFPDPVNVLSVSSLTCSLSNDPVVKSCTNKDSGPGH
ncbi:uncharacterized protein V6R79_013873 [Siganus canaliculatus]